MLAHALRKGLKDLKICTESAQYCNEANNINENVIDKDFEDIALPSDSEVAEYIVENPNEFIVELPINNTDGNDLALPFFKSIHFKLWNNSIVNI